MCDLLTVCTSEQVGSNFCQGGEDPGRPFRSCGRFAKISKNVEAGDEILHEMPFAVGPKNDSPLCCLGCYHYLDEAILCEKCMWPICTPECSLKIWHRDYECPIFAKAGVVYNPEAEPGPHLECIAPLRALVAKEKEPNRWASEVSPMVDHNQLRKGNQELWEAERINVVEFLRNKCKLADRFSEELIHKVCGILEVNAYEILPDPMAVPIRGIYPKAGVPSHNCIANTTHSIFSENYKMVMRATVSINEGSEVFCSYTSSLNPTMIRRGALKSTKYFECDCERCKDPKELGTHLSSIKCPSCDNGLILSSNPLDIGAEWKCTHCDKSLPAEIVQRIHLKMQNDLAQLEYMEAGPEKLVTAEKLLRTYKSSVHPHHAVNLSIGHILAQLYGRVEGYTIDMLPDVLLERKAQFSQQLLDALAVVEPGMTRMRGRMLFELHVAHLMMSRTKLLLKVIGLDQFKQEINNVILLLEECAKILSLEPADSADFMLSRNADTSASQLRNSIENMTELPE